MALQEHASGLSWSAQARASTMQTSCGQSILLQGWVCCSSAAHVLALLQVWQVSDFASQLS